MGLSRSDVKPCVRLLFLEECQKNSTYFIKVSAMVFINGCSLTISFEKLAKIMK